MDVAILTALISALAALGGAWWGGRMTYKSSLIRYEAMVQSTYKREWVTALRTAIAELLGQAHLFLHGYVYQGTDGDNRISIIRDLGIAKTRVQVLLDNQVGTQRELNDLCNQLFANLTDIRRFNANEAAVLVNNIASTTEVLARRELINIRRPNENA